MEGRSRKGLKICCGVSIGFVLLVVILIIAIGVIANTTEVEPNVRPTAEPTVSRSASLSDADIVETFEQTPGVVEAAITRRGNQISLVVIVSPLTSEARAKQIGDNFVRMFKSLSDDSPPGATIGTGKYDYIIVSTDQTRVR